MKSLPWLRIPKKKYWTGGHTHESEIVSNWPWENRGKYLKTSTNTAGYTIPTDYFSLKNRGDTLSFFDVNEEQKNNGELLPEMGYLQIYGWKATYCNFFAYDLSKQIFGHVPWGTPKRANDIHKYMLNNSDFLEISIQDVFEYISSGLISFYTQYGPVLSSGGRGPGHIATSWIEEGVIIQAGDQTGICDPSSIFSQDRLKVHLYLGFLRKKNL